jgi:hypothetical protein
MLIVINERVSPVHNYIGDIIKLFRGLIPAAANCLAVYNFLLLIRRLFSVGRCLISNGFKFFIFL